MRKNSVWIKEDELELTKKNIVQTGATREVAFTQQVARTQQRRNFLSMTKNYEPEATTYTTHSESNKK